MPRNGSGLYSRTNGVNSGATTWGQDAAQGLDILSTNHDTHDQDIADGLTNSIAKDGQTVPTGNLQMGGFRHINVGDAQNTDEYATKGQLDQSIIGENLLINPTFQINQRPAVTGTYDLGDYIIDRWAGGETGTSVSFGSNGVVNLDGGILQAIEIPDGFGQLGDKVTVSVLNPSQDVHVFWDQTPFAMVAAEEKVITAGSGRRGVTFDYSFGVPVNISVNFITSSLTSFFLPKVELGSFATSFQPRPIATELALCQRYFEKIEYSSNVTIATIIASSTADARGYFTYARKRVAPSISLSGSLSAFELSGEVITLGAFSSNLDRAVISVDNASSNFTSGNPYSLVGAVEISIDAEISP